MKIYLRSILWLIGSFAVVPLVQSQSQEGFISLDCGLPNGEKYEDTNTTLNFTSDADFISSGARGMIKAEYSSNLFRYMLTVRSFPEGKRNCYNLNVVNGTRYLIMASFLYGNYDDLNVLPSFDVYIGPNKWISVELQQADTDQTSQLIHTATSEQFQFCLVKTGPTTPFISALQLRPLRIYSYAPQPRPLSDYGFAPQSRSLQNLQRWYFASNTTSIIRFSEDVYDRIWHPYFQDDWKQINTTLHIETDDFFAVPQRALRTAATPQIDTEPLVISLNLTTNDTQLHIFMHVAEIETLEANETREFNMIFNGIPRALSFRPLNFIVYLLANTQPEQCPTGRCTVELRRTTESTLPPLLNAFEVYSVVNFPQLETDQNEVEAIENIKANYDLSRIDWQGDPCAPQELMWDGLNCSNKAYEPPRITSLNLSSSKLTGIIAAYIQNLTQLEKLDLWNNALTGEVPQFLVDMKSLSVINLSRNNLNGSVPQGLLDREKAGSLKLK